MKQIGVNYPKKETVKETCICLTFDKILVGTDSGLVYAYDLDTDKPFCVYKEDGKDFKDNPVTTIDVHPWRSEYIVIGFERG